MGVESVDLAELEGAGGLLRYRAAREGRVVRERGTGEHERFWTDAVHFWCDAQPILEQGFRGVLEGLGP